MGVATAVAGAATKDLTVKQVLKNAGFGGGNLIIATAICIAESGGDAKARNKNSDGTTDRGMVQFNDKWHSEVSDSCADNPHCAAKEMYRVSNHGKDFHEWSTFQNKAYVAFLGQDRKITNYDKSNDAPGFTKKIDSAGNVSIDGLKAIGAFLVGLTKPELWIRVSQVIVGLIMLVLGFRYLLNLDKA